MLIAERYDTKSKVKSGYFIQPCYFIYFFMFNIWEPVLYVILFTFAFF